VTEFVQFTLERPCYSCGRVHQMDIVPAPEHGADARQGKCHHTGVVMVVRTVATGESYNRIARAALESSALREAMRAKALAGEEDWSLV